jgi:hypothetical protein
MKIIFGEKISEKNSRPAVRHLSVRKFVPVYERTEECWVRDLSMNSRSGYREVPRYERGEYNFWQIYHTSKPRTLWAIARARLSRVGQLKFL